MASSFTSTVPFAAASHHPLPPACLSREAGMLLRRHLDFQRLLVATEAAAEQHRDQHQNETGVGSRQYQLELNRLLVVSFNAWTRFAFHGAESFTALHTHTRNSLCGPCGSS